MHKGQIESKRATIAWDDNTQNLFMHIPILFHNVFINVQRDLFTVLSGALLWYKNGVAPPVCKGNITIDRGRFNKNIFSSRAQKNLAITLNNYMTAKEPFDFDLAIKTKKPLHINTPFLQTNVAIDLLVNGKFHDPQISGQVNLVGGTITLSHRPLYITRCKLYFLPHRIHDPIIELIARGHIRKYNITVRLTGSVQHPHFNFESMPPLTEDQIITLLLSGSDEGSLLLAMPSLIMKNLQSLMFDPEQVPSKFEGYIKHLLIPFKHIRIVPSFMDQTGRGGFRGIIEIDVNDQLHALIQKNFSLSEDTRFEVEYLISDDISIRGIKDERGDLGGEVEIRWKF